MRPESRRWAGLCLIAVLAAAPAAVFPAEGKPHRNEVTIACVNFHANWGDKSDNLERIAEAVRTAAGRGAELILFPELALTGYEIDPEREMHRENAETVPGPSSLAIAELTRELGVYVVFGLPEKSASEPGILYNSAAVVGPEGIIGSYAKLMPFGREMTWCAKGKTPFLFDSPWGPVGVGICYDSYMFPELARFYAAMGARVYLHITALGEFSGWREYYLNQMRARAIENMMCVASSNLMGKDRTASFPGAGLIVAPGRAIHQVEVIGGPDQEEQPDMVLAEVDLKNADRMRARYPLFRPNRVSGTPDWRLDLYLEMLKTIRERTRRR